MTLHLELLEEAVVESEVVGELRVEGGDDDVALPAEHGVGIDRREHLDAGPRALDEGSPDEHGSERIAVDPVDLEVGLERVDLAAEGVATHRDVDGAEAALVVRSEEHTSELASLMRISSAVYCLKK